MKVFNNKLRSFYFREMNSESSRTAEMKNFEQKGSPKLILLNFNQITWSVVPELYLYGSAGTVGPVHQYSM